MMKQNKELLFNRLFKLDIQLFSEEDKEEENENKDVEEKKENKNGDGEENKVTMTQKQFSDRLKREKEKTIESLREEFSNVARDTIASFLKEQKEKEVEEKKFEQMKDEDKEKYLQEKKENDLKERERKVEEQLKLIAEKESKDIIMNAYDEDKLPCREIFSNKIAPYIARLGEEDKIVIYNGIKDIIENVKTTSFNEALKQNPPKNGDGNNSGFASNRFIKYQQDKQKRTKYEKK